MIKHDVASEPQERTSVTNQLAAERNHMANERTLLAYARTAIMLVATGATVLKLFAESPLSIVAGWAAMVLGAILAFLGVVRFEYHRRRTCRRTHDEC